MDWLTGVLHVDTDGLAERQELSFDLIETRMVAPNLTLSASV